MLSEVMIIQPFENIDNNDKLSIIKTKIFDWDYIENYYLKSVSIFVPQYLV